MTACGGGGTTPTPPIGGTTQDKTTTVAFTVKVPGTSIQTAHGRKPLYVSRDTKGIGIVFQAHSGSGYGIDSASCTSLAPCTQDYSPNAGMAIAPGSGSCGTAVSGGSYTCTVYISGVPVGYDDFRFTLWNAAPAALPATCAANGTGCSFTGDKAISVQTLANYGILSGQNNIVPLTATFYPIVDSVAVSTDSGMVDGSPSTFHAWMTLRDSSGDIILGTDPLIDEYGNALTLTMHFANNLGADSCSENTTGTPCSLHYTAPANPAFTTANAAAAPTSVSYDGAVVFPATNQAVGTIAIGGTWPIGSQTTVGIQIGINPPHDVTYLVATGPSQSADTFASNLAAAINADSTDSGVITAYAVGPDVVLESIVNGASGEYGLSLSNSGGGTATGSGNNLSLTSGPQVTVSTGSVNAGVNLPASVAVTQSNSGGVTIPAAPQVGTVAGVSAPGRLTEGSDGKFYVVSSINAIDQVSGATVSAVTLPDGNASRSIVGVTSGSDGYLWWSDYNLGRINHQNVGTNPAGTFGSVGVYGSRAPLAASVGLSSAPNVGSVTFTPNTGGSITTGTNECIALTYLNAYGESVASSAQTEAMGPNTELVISNVPASSGATKYGVYAYNAGAGSCNATPSSSYLQVATASIGSSYTLTADSALVAANISPVTAAPDGNMWFVDAANQDIYDVAPTDLSAPAAHSFSGVSPQDFQIAAGTLSNSGSTEQAVCVPNGAKTTVNCWKIGTGALTAFTIPGGSTVSDMAIGPDDLLYVVTLDGHVYALYDNAGTMTQNFTYTLTQGVGEFITSDAYDGSMWITERKLGIARIQIESTGTPPASAGTLVEYPMSAVYNAGNGTADFLEIIADPSTGWLYTSDSGENQLDQIQTH